VFPVLSDQPGQAARIIAALKGSTSVPDSTASQTFFPSSFIFASLVASLIPAEQTGYLLRNPATTKPMPPMRAIVLRIGEIGTVCVC
jgi:hypothetical protein